VTPVGIDREVDVVVVGGGPSGSPPRRGSRVTAAGWSSSIRASTGPIGSSTLTVTWAATPQTPRELLARGRQEVLAYPTASIVTDVVESASPSARGFAVALRDGGLVLGHKLVLACGVRDARPDVPGLEEHYGASVFHCPACDGYEARDRDVVALGWSENLVGFAATLLGWARSVTVVTGGERFRGDDVCRALLDRHGIETIEERVVELVGRRGDLRAARVESGRALPCSLAFFSVAHQPRTELAQQLGCTVDDDGYVEINDCGRTTVDGVYAAGDLVPGLQLTSIAVAKGVVAGVGCAQSFFGRPTAVLAPDAAPDLPAERERLTG
jgi:thioredoxin reductase